MRPGETERKNGRRSEEHLGCMFMEYDAIMDRMRYPQVLISCC